MLKHILFVLIAIHTIEASGQYAMGCFPENLDNKMVVEKKYPVQRGGSMPYYFSLAKYAPPVGHQGQLGSCTSWATAYAGFTIIKRMETNNNYLQPFSPLDLHNRLKTKSEVDPCTGGTPISSALEMLKNYGGNNENFNASQCNYQTPYNNYYHKLFNFERLNVSSYNFKYALYNEKSPIIICIKSYNSGWDRNSNIINGVWNGYYDYPNGGYHAMCIIGYDDSKNGGAFLVMNSWGSSWGENGFFWIKYEDLGSITDAYSMSPGNGANEVRYDGGYSNQLNAKYFRMYNECSVTAYLSCAKRVNGYWKSIGWYAIQPNSYYDFYIGDRDTREIYWIASNNQANLKWWDNTGNGKNFCYEAVNAFEYADYDNCSNKIAYYRFDPEASGSSIGIHTITCPTYQRTRGDSSIKQNGSSFSNLFDSRRADTANIFWKKEFLLFDLLSGKMILPSENEGKSHYDIWYIDDNKQIKNNLFDPRSLEKIKKPKFNSRSNAEKWMELNK